MSELLFGFKNGPERISSKMFFEHFLNFLIAWAKSRSWRQIGLLLAGLAILPIVSASLVVTGMIIPPNALAADYQRLIDEQLERNEAASETSESSDTNRALQIPLRRILQMDAANERIRYFVALELDGQGRTSMAARMMREIAPTNQEGYPDAHSWLASYALFQRATSGKEFSRPELEQLEHDLRIAVNKSSTVVSAHIEAYSGLLAQNNRQEEALALLRGKARQFPQLYILYARLAEELDEQSDLKAAIRDGTELLESRLESGKANVSDLTKLVTLTLIDDNPDKAVALSSAAVEQSPEDPTLRELYARALMAKYYTLDEGSQLATRMQILEAAFKASPASEIVVTEVTKAMADGAEMPEELRSSVEELLMDGRAPAIAHLTLANSKLSGDEPEAAIVHLELALQQLPDSAVILNNLAIALVQARPEEVDRAEQLVQQALDARITSKQILASIMDTQGQVRLAKAKNLADEGKDGLAKQEMLGAIESFEKAIGLDSSKLNTRESLAKAYEEVGMTDLAAGQLRRIREQRQALQENTPE